MGDDLGADARLVAAARGGDRAAVDRLVAAYLPLAYNVVGRALAGDTDVDDVVRETMLRCLAALGELRSPESLRAWLLVIAVRRARDRHRARLAAPIAERYDVADPGADFADLTILRLHLSGQRREVVEAVRWLDPDNRELLALWWLETVGELNRDELAAVLGLERQDAAVRVQRMRAQLDSARAVVRALDAAPRCPGLMAMTDGWPGRPAPTWRKRIARHARECPRCRAGWTDVMDAERLLCSIGYLAPPPALAAAITRAAPPLAAPPRAEPDAVPHASPRRAGPIGGSGSSGIASPEHEPGHESSGNESSGHESSGYGSSGYGSSGHGLSGDPSSGPEPFGRALSGHGSSGDPSSGSRSSGQGSSGDPSFGPGSFGRALSGPGSFGPGSFGRDAHRQGAYGREAYGPGPWGQATTGGPIGRRRHRRHGRSEPMRLLGSVPLPLAAGVATVLVIVATAVGYTLLPVGHRSVARDAPAPAALTAPTAGASPTARATATAAPTRPSRPSPTAAPKPVPPAPPVRSSPKKGVSTWEFSKVKSGLTAVDAAWYYNWSPTDASTPAPSGVQFVPMIWGADAVTDGTLAMARLEGDTLLGFNEPDLAEQSNLTVDRALGLWPRLQATGLRLGSPAPARGAADPDGWLDRFMTGARQRGYRVDFIALHWYGSDFSPAAVGHLRSYLEATHQRYGLPIWLTEFALINFGGGAKYPTDAQQAAFIAGATKMLQGLPFVQRYAWFGLPATRDGGTGLVTEDGALTAAGRAYRAAG